MDNWSHVRWLARQLRAEVEALEGIPLQSEELVNATARKNKLTLVFLPPDDPILGGARSLLDTTVKMIAIDDDIPKEAKVFSIAHEIGHLSLHGGVCFCAAEDVSEVPNTTQLPYAEGAIETYDPRQRRETEANVFAAEFLMPSHEVQHLFVDEKKNCSQIASHFGVSQTAMLNQMATILLTPILAVEADFDPNIQLLPPVDETQAFACHVPQGPVLVDAGPGTGKTLTLVHRILHLLQDRQVHPENILALTFSNKAASEMHIRLARVAPDQAQIVTICTFHAFCLDLLRRYAPQAGLSTGIRILDPVDAVVLLEQNLKDLDLIEFMNLAVPNLYLDDILRAISRAKDELVGPEEYAQLAQRMFEDAGEDEAKQRAAAKAAEVAHVFRHYQDLLASEGLVDFDDLIVFAVSLLQENPAVLDIVRRQYRHILVDEYQDVNRASAILLKLLADDGAGLWAVGDLRQAIYRFRGASPVNIGRFEEDYPGGYRLSLGFNYRSLPPLVELFGYVAQNMPLDSLPAPNWRPKREVVTEMPVTFAISSDDQAEICGLAEAIEARRARKRDYNQQAILCRTHAQAATLAKGLEGLGIPVSYLGSLFERSEIKDMLALLSLACENDGTGLVRVARITEHSMDTQDVQAILAYAQATDQRFPGVLEHAEEIDSLSAEGIHTALDLARLLTPMAYKTDTWVFLVRYLFEYSSYARCLLRSLTVSSRQCLIALGQLLQLARGFSELPLADPDEDSKRAFLNYVRRLITSRDSRIYWPLTTEHIDAVHILTVHASKGLEFPIVYLPNLSEGRFPPWKQWDPAPPPPGLSESADEDRLVEEACLFFVALSRARDELVLSQARRYGKRSYKKPSSLLDMVHGFFLTSSPVDMRWECKDKDDIDDGVVLISTLAQEASNSMIELDIADIERYWRCPRQYYYARVLSLREPERRLGYKQFHDCVYQTADWIRDLHLQGALPQEWKEVESQFEREWECGGPAGHVHEELYKEAAHQMLHQLWQSLQGAPLAREPWMREVTVELDRCRIRVRIDHAEVLEDQSLLLIRYRTGKVREDDRKQPRLALYREAVRQLNPRHGCRIALQYLKDGRMVEVPDQGRWEQKRLEKIATAAQSIATGDFRPQPDKSSYCATCTFFIVCPGSCR